MIKHEILIGIFMCFIGGDIFHSPIAESLPTLPFDVLRKLYDSTPLSTDDGRLLRRISINTATVHLLLVCLGIFTHQTEVGGNGGEKEKEGAAKEEVKRKDDKSQLYWAKGMKLIEFSLCNNNSEFESKEPNCYS